MAPKAGPIKKPLGTPSKEWRLIKETTFEFGYFTTIFGDFLANYIHIFHKTEVLMIIFKGLNVSKSQLDKTLQHKSQMLLTTVIFNFGRKKVKNQV